MVLALWKKICKNFNGFCVIGKKFAKILMDFALLEKNLQKFDQISHCGKNCWSMQARKKLKNY
jgi:hypothetical protein